MAAFIGGIVAQEVLKTTGKFTPIHQFAYFDASSAIGPNISAEDRKPIGSRYDGQIAVFGKQVQEQLQKLKLFLVGSGALGCELLKNFAMMGIGKDALLAYQLSTVMFYVIDCSFDSYQSIRAIDRDRHGQYREVESLSSIPVQGPRYWQNEVKCRGSCGKGYEQRTPLECNTLLAFLSNNILKQSL